MTFPQNVDARPFRVGDRVVTGDGNGEQTIARVITEPEHMYSDDSGLRVRVEFQVASTVTRTPLVSHVRHAEHADEIHIIRAWLAANGYADFRALANVVAENEKLRADLAAAEQSKDPT